MIPYTIACANCGKTRIARQTEDGIDPVLQACPNCECSDFEVLANS